MLMNGPLLRGTVLLALGAALPGAAAGQDPGAPPLVDSVPLALATAVDSALAGNGTLRAADARADAAERMADASGGFILPQVEATAGGMRTDDPVGVFGARLRQGIFTEQDFDVAALNDPDAIADWSAGVGARWEIGSPSRWQAREAARAEGTAARTAVARTAEGTIYRTRVLYARALEAGEAALALDAAMEAARATLDRVERRVAEGMGTDADLLQAQAAVGEIEARRIQVGAAVQDSRDALAVHLGWGPDRVPVPVDDPAVLAERLAVALADVDASSPAERADLKAARAQIEAAEARVDEVQARRLPRLEGYGMVSTHTGDLTGRWEPNYTLGLQLSIPLFTGFSLSNGAEAAEANLRALNEEQLQRERTARSEVRSALRGVEAAEASLRSAEGAAAAASEAVRLVRRRYEEGMATVAELLQAQARSAALDQGVAEARARLIIALATLDFARGNPDSLTTIDR